MLAERGASTRLTRLQLRKEELSALALLLNVHSAHLLATQSKLSGGPPVARQAVGRPSVLLSGVLKVLQDLERSHPAWFCSVTSG